MTTPHPNRRRVAFIGFGEAGAAFATGLKGREPFDLSAFDLKTARADARDAKLADYAALGVTPAETDRAAVAGAEVVFSLVTADQAQIAAEAAAKALTGPTLFFDCNSCAPQMKQRSAAAIEAAGGRYVDVAVMAPVHPRLHRTPLLISGPHAAAALEAMAALDMDASEAAGPVGRASAIKLTRSVIVKGLEALMAESLAAGLAQDVMEPVLASLEDSHPGLDWRDLAAGGQDRMALHGLRRAAEMEAAAEMLSELGLPNEMAAATALWERRKGEGRPT